MCLHVNRRAHVACNLNRLIENEVRFKVTVSHVHRESGFISGMVQSGDVFTADHYRNSKRTVTLFICSYILFHFTAFLSINHTLNLTHIFLIFSILYRYLFRLCFTFNFMFVTHYFTLLCHYRTVAIPMTLSDLQVLVPNAGLLNAIFRTVLQQLTRFQLT